jgi:hypothetical protein
MCAVAQYNIHGWLDVFILTSIDGYVFISPGSPFSSISLLMARMAS